jgi:phospholipid-binding lipoprotein MlaA
MLILSPVNLVGCAAQPPATEPAARALYQEANDPLEPTNRFLYRLSDAVTSISLTPAARAYRRAVPEQVRTGIANFFANLGNPIRFVNDILQDDPRRAGDTFMRFVINTTIGVGGILDVAREWGYPPHPADFGMTFAIWGAPPGPYLFIPLLGPSDLRDAVGTGVAAAPIAPLIPKIGSGATNTAVHWTTLITATVSGYSQNLPSIDEAKRTALDPYATFRSLFWQHRAYEIKAAEQRPARTVPIWFRLPPKARE